MLWAVVALIVVNLAVYAPVRHFDFVQIDDPLMVTENPHIAGGLTWEGVRWAFSADQIAYASLWIPLVWLSYMLDVQLFGLAPGAFHVTNLLFHIASTLVLFGVMRAMTGRTGRSAFVAALFAVHPLHVESVAWVTERKDVLSTFFWMLTMAAYVAYVRRPHWWRYSVMLGCFVLGLLTKPMLATLPFALLLLDVWPLGRVTIGGGAPSPASRPAWRIWLRLLGEKTPLLVLTAIASVVAFVAQHKGDATLALRLQNAIISYVAYIGKTAWPVLSLIRFRGHFPKGEYDVHDGTHPLETTPPTTVHG